MKELERRALMGDRQAQEECSKQEILLPCPFCGSRKIILSNWGMWRCWCSECLGKGDDELRRHDAVRDWNRRPAPPIGRCKDCDCYWPNAEQCGHSDETVKENDFCSKFKPKEAPND